MIAGNLGNMWTRFYTETNVWVSHGPEWPRMSPEGNEKKRILRKKWPRMPPEGNAVIENGKQQFFCIEKNNGQYIEAVSLPEKH